MLESGLEQSTLFYMAALKTEPGCLKCHANQGYRVGDIRGGISITMPFSSGGPLTAILVGHLLIGLSGFGGILLGLNKLKRAYCVIKQQSETDDLTGLANRRRFQQQLNLAITRCHRGQQGFALLLMDLDHFKEVNDSMGHPAGDKLLCLIADKLQQRFRDNDTIARLGGDEFALLLENVQSSHDVARVANQILQTFEAPWHLNHQQQVRVGISIGISLYPSHSQTATLLMQQADSAMYRSKESGRNCFHFYTDELTHSAMKRLQLERNLQQAIDESRINVCYQPVVALPDHRIIAAEALLRWHDPDGGIILPEQFLPVAEETGLIGLLGEKSLYQALQDGARWRNQNIDIDLCLNVSGFQIHHSDFLSLLRKALEETGFPAGKLCLELTEEVLMERELESMALLNGIRQLGVRLAIDGFGTGYSSMAQLRHFPVEYLKIDRRFIHELNPVAPEKTVINAILKIGHAFSFRVIVSGVETTRQQHLLEQLGCDAVQGFLYSEALPPQSFAQLYQHYQQQQPASES